MSQAVTYSLFGALVAVAIISTFVVMARASKGYDKAKQRRVERGVQTPCPICRSSMELVGVQELKVREPVTAIDDRVAGKLGASGGNLPLEVHRCPTCRNVQLFLPPSAG